MTWNIVTNSNDCDWLFIDIPGDMKSGRVERICSHPESDSRFCAQETCPKKVDNSRKYRKYEFCRAVNCRHYYPENRFEVENCTCVGKKGCPFTAKEFHQYLNDHGFDIRKKESA